MNLLFLFITYYENLVLKMLYSNRLTETIFVCNDKKDRLGDLPLKRSTIMIVISLHSLIRYTYKEHQAPSLVL